MNTVQDFMDAARKAHNAGNADHARRLVNAARKIEAEAETRRATPQGFNVVGNDDKGGTLYKMPDGRFQYVSPSISKTYDSMPKNLDFSAGIKEETRGQLAEQIVQERPIASRAASAFAGTLGVGEFLDNLMPGRAGSNMRLAQEGMKTRPFQDAALRLGGGIASAVPAALAAPAGVLTMGARSLGGRILGSGIMGGATGAAEGALSQIGANDYAENRMQGVPQAAATQGMLGAVLGGAAEPVSDLGGALYRRMGGGAARRARRSQSALGLDDQGAQIVADAAARDAAFAPQNIARSGRYATVASSGPNTANLLDWAVNRPGSNSELRSTLDRMGEEAASQLQGSLDRNFAPVQGPKATQRAIMQNSSASRGEAYREAYTSPIDYASADGQSLLSTLTRVPKAAWKKAERLMKTEGEGTLQFKINADTGVIEELPDVRTLDYLTRALRDMGDFGVGEGKEQGRAFMGLAREIRQEVDGLVPAYAAARQAGRDAIVNREAVDVGRSAFSAKMTREDLSDEVSGMGGEQLKFVRIGARGYIDDVMARTKAAMTDANQDVREVIKPLQNLLSREGQDKIKIILGDEAGADFVRELQEVYGPMSLRASVAQNSKTQMRGSAEDILTEAAGTTMMEGLAEGRGILGAVTQQAGPLVTRGALDAAGRKTAISDAIGQALMRAPTAGPGQGLLAQTLNQNLAQAMLRQQLIEGGIRRSAFAGSQGLQQMQFPQ